MKRQKGFTLVELLVVIGIIAVLIGILLPALNKARQNAKRVECAAYMRQVIQAAINYGTNNRGMLPPMRLDNKANDPTFSAAFTAYYALDDGTSANPNPGSSIRRLITTKYLTDSRMEKCPSSADLSDPSRAMYYFNPHMASFTSAGGGLQQWWKKLSGFGKPPVGAVTAYNVNSGTQVANYTFPRRPYAIVCDPMNGMEYATHAVGRARAWNLGYVDGSVRIVTLDERVTRAGANKFGRTLDILHFLESYADGSSSVNSAAPAWGTYPVVPIDPR